MNTQEKLVKRVDSLIELADRTLASRIITGDGMWSQHSVNEELFSQLQSSCLSFIEKLFGKNHSYYNKFIEINMPINPKFVIDSYKGILLGVKEEIEQGWLTSVKGLVSAEIFTDFLEMAEHLLNEGYKDPAAVMIGSTLEEHLRQLCDANEIDTFIIRNEKEVPKRANSINDDLAKEGVYNMLDQKQVTAWLDLRNKAAHGKYDEYTKEQVEQMLQGVLNFISRNSI
ncbi:hypothetical protein [Bernardetia sp. MNP-M8]|uniref:hypothetical protein n=1 Tax=Bernardetia sp. MNP-M8 TaxID=3127470 RepID=UPI0030CE9D70